MSDSIKFSKYQQAIFDRIVLDLANGEAVRLVIEAVAGSGKSFTIETAHNIIAEQFPDLSVVLVAFNKSIADELKSRDLNARTFHSIGSQAWKDYCGKYGKLDTSKTFKIMKEHISYADSQRYGDTVRNLVKFAKDYGVVPGYVRDVSEGYNGCQGVINDTLEQWAWMADHHDIEIEDMEEFSKAIDIARMVLEKTIDSRAIIDFADMLYLPVIHNAKFTKFDVVFVDEAQDVSGIQRTMIRMMTKPGRGSLIAVGDPYQAIYGFRGADSQSIDRIKADFGCESMPLSITYRCASKIVKEAQQLVPILEPRPEAPEGVVKYLEKYSVADFCNEDLIVCRNTAPLISQAYGFIARGVGVNVLGRDIGAGLNRLIKNLKVKSVEELMIKLREWEERETALAMRENKETKAQSIEDKAQCIRAIVSNSMPESINDITAQIEKMFGDKRDSRLTLCTIHKAKGLEADTVFVLNRYLMPSKYAKQEWQKIQERNVEYVALTRAKTNLFFVESGQFTDELEEAA